MRNLLRALTMVKSLKEVTSASVRPAAYSSDVNNAGYREAIKALNLLQTNASVLQEVRKKRKLDSVERSNNVSDTYKFLTRSGVSLEDLDSLPVIHVAGTKGKGSTCAFCESILRNYGMNKKKQTLSFNAAFVDESKPIYTGLYTSPHLVEVRERIQLGGKPISQELFSSYFWNVYNVLMEKREHEGDMPPYFKFLTVLAFNIFIREGVDVAVIEVGIGGEHDCTNVIRKPIAVGVSSLGLDHQSILGETLDKIAWQKAGILKKGSPAFTALGQSPNALRVLEERAREKEVVLKVCPPFSSYILENSSLKLPGFSKCQELNASLALQLANAWIKWRQGWPQDDSMACTGVASVASPFKVDSSLATGLEECKWPGRTQIFHWHNYSNICGPGGEPFHDANVTLFLDGAHTRESIGLCLEWFKEESMRVSSKESKLCNGEKNDDPIRILVFNSTGDRNVEGLIAPLAKSKLFHYALFTPNTPKSTVNVPLDLMNSTVSQDQQNARCQEHLTAWLKLSEHSQGFVFNSVCDALSSIAKVASPLLLSQSERANVHILVSGSLHLVGSVLSIVDPNLSSS